MPDAQRQHSRAALVADARDFAETLEDAHPDPYSGHGGRVAFHRRLEELVREIPDDGEPLDAFHRRLQAFAARVRDGHTKVTAPDDAGDDVPGRLPLGFRVVGPELYVDEVYDDAHRDLLGGRLVAVDGVPVPDLRQRQALVESSENEYGDRYRLTGTLGDSPDTLPAVLDADTTNPTFTVETLSGDTRERTLSPVEAGDPVASLDAALPRPETNGEPAFEFLDDAALLVLPDCHSHREVHEIAAAMGGQAGEHYDAREAHRRLVGDPVPDDHGDVLAALPSATERLTDLVEEMAARGTDALVIDTRGNTGGSSLLAYLLVYLLHGFDGVREAASDQYSVSKDSRLLRDHYGDDAPIRDTDNHAGFDFHSYFREDADSGEAVLDGLADRSETFAREVESGEHAGYYAPETVVVITSAETFSAGVEPGILLSKLGATIAGVPSAQAPNGPRDVLTDSLPNTGLDYGVSYRHHVFQPGEPGDVFRPDVELTPARFEALGRPADAGVQLALRAADGSLGELDD